MPRARLLENLLAVAVVAGCGGIDGGGARDGGPDRGADGAGSDVAGGAPAAPSSYPSLAMLYAGPQGVYRGCGPNGGVCHNGREYPNLATMGSIVDNIGKPCNEKRDDPATLHDLCERSGDFLALGVGRAEIGSAETTDPEKLRWRLRLASEIPPAARGAAAKVVRPFAGQLIEIYDLAQSADVVRDPADGRTVWLTIEAADRNEVTFLQRWLGRAGVPGDPGSLQVGDPNRNGVFGATLGGALVKPGAPEKSYLLLRLLDPEAGPVMPRANCCGWSKSSLRALWCWVAGLAPDGGNALDPIGYDRCPPLPKGADDILYPEAGPACETSGMCPVRSRSGWPEGTAPTFTNLYKYVLQPSCGGGTACHDAAQPGAGLSMKTEGEAFRDLLSADRPRVVPGRPEGSLLVKRISPELCAAPSCVPMPLGRPPLDAKLRELVTTWIATGAKP